MNSHEFTRGLRWPFLGPLRLVPPLWPNGRFRQDWVIPDHSWPFGSHLHRYENLWVEGGRTQKPGNGPTAGSREIHQIFDEFAMNLRRACGGRPFLAIGPPFLEPAAKIRKGPGMTTAGPS